ncbi:MAG: TMEM14 family protein [Pleurocapsa sp.]
MLTPELIATALYGLLSLVGGIFGYTKSKSKVSLISGGVSGLILLALAGFIYAGNQWLGFVAAGIIALLVVVFAIRWSKTKKFMPAVPMIFFGVVSLVLILS